MLANLLALAGVCPFVGSLSDLIGRRYVAIIGSSLICLGMIVSSTANTMNIFIGKLADPISMHSTNNAEAEWQSLAQVPVSAN